jgi:hypothetical protein
MLKSAIYIIVIAVIFGFVCGLSPSKDGWDYVEPTQEELLCRRLLHNDVSGDQSLIQQLAEQDVTGVLQNVCGLLHPPGDLEPPQTESSTRPLPADVCVMLIFTVYGCVCIAILWVGMKIFEFFETYACCVMDGCATSRRD